MVIHHGEKNAAIMDLATVTESFRSGVSAVISLRYFVRTGKFL